MLNPLYINQFVTDLKLAQKRGKNIEKLKAIIKLLINGDKLSIKFKDHQLIGNYANRRECHIESNWLLIYKVSQIEQEIIFERTGSHSDLFKS